MIAWSFEQILHGVKFFLKKLKLLTYEEKILIKFVLESLHTK